MFKRIIFAVCLLQFVACAELKQAAAMYALGELTSPEIASALKQALNLGIGKGSDQLSQKGGYLNSAYKILLPAEARKVTEKLRFIPGFTDVENVLLQKLNSGAEDAAVAAKPIFVDAIRNMTITDGLNILMGSDNAATQYLQGKTSTQLYQAFNPIIVNSLNKYDAIKYWKDAVSAYNKIPFVEKANPSLDGYVTNEALKGLFSMVGKEEVNIRRNPSQRTTDLLKRAFAKQDSNRK